MISPTVYSDKYSLERELGSGGFGTVWSAKRLCDGSSVAIKFIKRSKIAPKCWTTDPELGPCPIEVFVLKNIDHPNIISFIDYMADDNHCYLVTALHGPSWASIDLPPSPISENGFPDDFASPNATDLYECIERNGSFPENQARYIFNQILEAVSHLHSLNLVHRDIKDENILIDQDYQIKLIDFGAVSSFEPSKETHFNSFFGTLQYAAPEILSNLPYSGPKAEIWALGCCLYIMLTGNIPFANTEQALSFSFTTPSISLSSSCLNLLNGMLHKDPKRRFSLDNVVEHLWTNY